MVFLLLGIIEFNSHIDGGLAQQRGGISEFNYNTSTIPTSFLNIYIKLKKEKRSNLSTAWRFILQGHGLLLLLCC